MSSRQTTLQAQEMAKAMAKEIAKQMLARSGRLAAKRTPNQSETTQSLAGIAQIWQSDDMTQDNKTGWQALADGLNTQQGRTGRDAYTAFSAFVNIATACQSVNLAVPMDAPGIPAQPVSIPPTTLTASVSSDTPPSLTLTLRSDLYNGNIQVWAGTKPSIVGKKIRTTAPCVLLGRLDGITPMGVGIDGLYTAKLSVPKAGQQLLVKLVPVSITGFRGTPLLLTATVTDASAAAAPVKVS